MAENIIDINILVEQLVNRISQLEVEVAVLKAQLINCLGNSESSSKESIEDNPSKESLKGSINPEAAGYI